MTHLLSSIWRRMKRGLKKGLLYLNDSEALQETCPKTAHANEDTKTLNITFLFNALYLIYLIV